eukprot:CAMPEP_0180254306 /NCGR_PEP_ID=MMETSP0987-20121128/40100_1 /TAXON_ID=697907 /ORGANISM="non described non described, Strain CCMP2293" /LENGTH=64 /DNA_ID=CAMNT_0022223305 /DNA_START=70 /DNA_END=264 /DNA_ORIENTATION=-
MSPVEGGVGSEVVASNASTRFLPTSPLRAIASRELPNDTTGQPKRESSTSTPPPKDSQPWGGGP